MATKRRVVAGIAFAACLSVVTACGSTSKSPAPPTGSATAGGANAANVNAVGSPTSGGTLKLLGSGDVDHLDTASGYYTATYNVERAFTRQLLSYPATTDVTKANDVVADLATQVPTAANGGISADGLTYTIHIRPGAMWNTGPARPVTAQDEVLGMKRLCNPTKNAVGAPGYYVGVIAGMDTYCNAFANAPQTIDGVKAFITGNEISGVKAVDDTTVQFTLVKPASDFINILALPFSSPAPVEYLQYLPDDANFRTHTISDGPYTISAYTPSQSIMLDKNPAWTQSADPIRHQYVDHISVTEGQDEGPVQQQIEAGTVDLQWDTSVPTANVPALGATKDARLGVFPGYDTNPFLIFNLQSPSSGGALGKVPVRQALEYAVDKVALGQVYGGPSLNTPLGTVIPPGNVGYKASTVNPYATPGDRGDPAKCKTLLAAAGYPNGFTITDIARNSGKHPAVAQSIQADFAKCGVTTKILSVSAGDYYGKYLNDVNASKNGVWDISEPGWVPDWFGNNGRSVIEPLFDGRTYGPGSTDWGDYNSSTVNGLIDQALAATDQAAADPLWAAADKQIMADAAFIPFQTQKTPLFRSTRVHNAIFFAFAQAYDVTQIWLSPTG